VGCQNCAAGLDLAFHSSLVFVDEAAEDWPMLDPLAGAVGYGDGRAVVGGASSAIRCRFAAVAAALAVPGGQVGREADR
jgi:hypothetical protein